MRKVLGILLILLGVAVGLYVGLWWAFIGGIVAIVQLVVHGPLVGIYLAESILRVLAAGFLGWGSFVVLLIPGATMLGA